MHIRRNINRILALTTLVGLVCLFFALGQMIFDDDPWYMMLLPGVVTFGSALALFKNDAILVQIEDQYREEAKKSLTGQLRGFGLYE